mmetsp:Transcript_19448/g.54198  ORF Transcript_19448/g.54198 Transcript_19448/m.54198 type:complete len:218 (-) Transcript_19448:1809-2462(-)
MHKACRLLLTGRPNLLLKLQHSSMTRPRNLWWIVHSSRFLLRFDQLFAFAGIFEALRSLSKLLRVETKHPQRVAEMRQRNPETNPLLHPQHSESCWIRCTQSRVHIWEREGAVLAQPPARNGDCPLWFVRRYRWVMSGVVTPVLALFSAECETCFFSLRAVPTTQLHPTLESIEPGVGRRGNTLSSRSRHGCSFERTRQHSGVQLAAFLVHTFVPQS